MAEQLSLLVGALGTWRLWPLFSCVWSFVVQFCLVLPSHHVLLPAFHMTKPSERASATSPVCTLLLQKVKCSNLWKDKCFFALQEIKLAWVEFCSGFKGLDQESIRMWHSVTTSKIGRFLCSSHMFLAVQDYCSGSTVTDRQGLHVCKHLRKFCWHHIAIIFRLGAPENVRKRLQQHFPTSFWVWPNIEAEQMTLLLPYTLPNLIGAICNPSSSICSYCELSCHK